LKQAAALLFPQLPGEVYGLAGLLAPFLCISILKALSCLRQRTGHYLNPRYTPSFRWLLTTYASLAVRYKLLRYSGHAVARLSEYNALDVSSFEGLVLKNFYPGPPQCLRPKHYLPSILFLNAKNALSLPFPIRRGEEALSAYIKWGSSTLINRLLQSQTL
jgi:hypothetical protein